MSIIVIPDSFKGSMTSTEVTDIICDELSKVTDENIIKIPIADGGEGSTDCILATLGGKKVTVTVKSPEMKNIEASYGITENGLAVIEIAESSGITKQTSFDAKNATTYGFGQLIKDALDKGCREFLLCLGGSATSDCGAGMAAALGAKFDGVEIPTGGSLCAVKNIDISSLDPRIMESKFTVMCDVENPLYGENGAAYVYGPQKGATEEDVKLIDAGLKSFSECMTTVDRTYENIASVPGAGAAGGAGYACMAFLGATLKSGIETMLEINKFDEKIKDCSRVITGEGKLDEQSFMGKVLSGIMTHSGSTKVTAFCGICSLTDDEKNSKNIDIIEIGRGIDVNESIKNGKVYLQKAAEGYFSRIF